MNSRFALTFVLMACLAGCGFRTGLLIDFDSGSEQADASSSLDGGEIDAGDAGDIDAGDGGDFDGGDFDGGDFDGGDFDGGDFDGGDGGFEGDFGLTDSGTTDTGIPFDGGMSFDASRPDAAIFDAGRDASTPDAGRDAAIPDAGRDASTPDAGRDASTPDAGRDASTPDAGRDASTPDAGRDASTPDAGRDASTPVDATVPRDSGISGPTPCITSADCPPIGPLEQVCWTDIAFCAPRCNLLPGGAFSICSLLGNGSVCDTETGACVIP